MAGSASAFHPAPWRDGTCLRSAERVRRRGAAAPDRRYPSDGRLCCAEVQRGRGKIMRRAALKGIALAIAVLASPLAAQQADPAVAQLPPPPASDIPPPLPRPATEPLPPFPHYPRIAPREHDPNYRRHHTQRHAPSHRRAQAHRRARHAAAHHRARTHRHAAHHYFSKRTIRQCHRMTYRQIMRHRYCRMMIRQDLGAARQHSHRVHHRTTRHHRTHRHRR